MTEVKEIQELFLNNVVRKRKTEHSETSKGNNNTTSKDIRINIHMYDLEAATMGIRNAKFFF